jgi:hypothetical protein
MSDSDTRISWPRRVVDGTPVVGWHCRNCGEEIEHAYQPSLLKRCPNCGGNPQGVRGFEVEEFVTHQRRRLFDQLAERYAPASYPTDDPTCEDCGATEDVHLDPGDDLDALHYRCEDCQEFPRFWWQAGDHPGLLTREWIATCDDCGAEFTSIFGVTYRPYGRRGETLPGEDYCLRCTGGEWLRERLEVDERRRERRASA